MKSQVLIVFVLILPCFVLGDNGADLESKAQDEKASVSSASPNITISLPNNINCTNPVNGTCKADDGMFTQITQKFMENKGMITRTFYVLVGVTFIVVAYFVIKTIR